MKDCSQDPRIAAIVDDDGNVDVAAAETTVQDTTQDARRREHLLAGMRMTERLIAQDAEWIAMCEDDERDAFKQGCETRRESLERRTAQLYSMQCRAVEWGILDKVTVEYPQRLRERERLEMEVLDKAAWLPRHVQGRFNGRALVDLAHDRTFNRLVDRYAQPATATARPRDREHRPGTTRRTSSSSRTSSDPPSGSDSDEPPAALGYCDCCTPARPIRLCACGCRRDITHKRADAQTFGASCRQRLKRGTQPQAPYSTAARSCQCESGFFYRDAEGDAVCGLCGCWVAKVAASTVSADFLVCEALLRDNGVYVSRRLIPPDNWPLKQKRKAVTA